MRDLFVEPNFDEMKAIALTAKGDLKRLTHEQLESVKQTGEFEVSKTSSRQRKKQLYCCFLLFLAPFCT
jgi:hypothetical protein